ncbi:hypothetical protein [Oceanirhabdus sp. W0125-5]|uniref:hypothetical protein n=1 Tax=Oceanirhabdus sp. W0125-5 TaxID=2999116 RepID=UPI0022F30296|nr:hypothetical protein [Oceanirhabdus sp. W0125-5]WBW95606.1 hypothetical protein OW730_18175 [Oceanirhabdus sp. W0125-5]
MGYKNFFWAFIFLFDFRIGGFDILPDIIAYILFYSGLNKLSDRNENFAKGKVFAIPLIFLSIFDIYQVRVPFNEIGNVSYGGVLILLGIVHTIINLMMIYRICMGIAEEARLNSDYDLEEKALKRWKLYLIVNIALYVLMILPIPLLLFVILIISIVNYFLMLGLMNMASNRLE